MTGSVLVTGGSGFLGRPIVRHLVEAGREVRALARSDRARAALEDLGAKPILGDVFDREALVEAMRGVEVVYHMAGLNAFCLPDPSPLYRVNVEGSRNVVEAAAAAGVRRVVYTSSAATLGEEAGTVGSEESAHRGSFLSHYERSKYLAERTVFAVARSADVEVVSVNPASVQGPGRTGGTARLLIGYLNGKLRVALDTRVSLVDIDDCTDGHLLAEGKGVAGERYVLCGATLSLREALGILSTLTGARRPPRMLPPWVALTGAWKIGTLYRVLGRRAPVCPEMVRALIHGHAYDGGKAARDLRLRYTPVEETFRRTAAWYVEQGLVTQPLPGLRRDERPR